MGRRVPEGMFAGVIIPLVKLKRCITLNRPCKIPYIAVNCGAVYFFCEPGTYLLSNLQTTYSSLYSLAVPSGKVIFIILFAYFYWSAKVTNYF
jgi:hypothetical protein